MNKWLGRSELERRFLANNDYSEVRISNVALNQWQVFATYFATGTTCYSALGDAHCRRFIQWQHAIFNAAGNCSHGLAPSAGKTYEMSDFNLTTPSDASPHTFGGDLLHASGGIFFDGATGGSTITISKFQIDNEEICAESGTFTLAGNLYVTNNNIGARRWRCGGTCRRI